MTVLPKRKLNSEEIERLLKLVHEHDDHYSLFWNEHLQFYIICNDVFAWACSDVEEITSDRDIDLLERSYNDTKAKGYPDYGAMLYCCRHAKLRPQGAAYPKHKELWPLFDACGPEREVSLGNPKPHPSKQEESNNE